MYYPPIDLHGLAQQAGVDLQDALSRLMALYAEIDARSAQNTRHLNVPCQRGCDACCHESVFLTLLEFLCVWDWVQTHLDDTVRCGMVDKGLKLYAQNRHLIEAFDKPPPQGQRDHFSIACKLRFTCPLLGSAGQCHVYPARELLARLFGCSFNDDLGIYGCSKVMQHLAGQVVTLLPARGTARRLHDLPLTHRRQVYPYYIHLLYGADEKALPVAS